MNDLKIVKKRFQRSIILFVLCSVALLSGALFTWLKVTNENTRFFITFAIIIVVIAISIYSKTYFESLMNLFYIIKIRHCQASPLKIKIKHIEELEPVLVKLGFKQYRREPHYIMFSRMSKDKNRQIFKLQVLEVVVLILNGDEFYLNDVDGYIDFHMKENRKIKVDKLLITQIKVIDQLDEETKDKVKEIVFIRTQRGIISTINMGLLMSEGLAIGLFSESYNPSIYYKAHIETIKNIFN